MWPSTFGLAATLLVGAAMTALSGARPTPEALRLTWRQVTQSPEGARERMCGICGELRFDGAPVSEHVLIAMRDGSCIAGPTARRLRVAARRAAGLGFRRLRIIDLTPTPASRCRTRTARCRSSSTARSTTSRRCARGWSRAATVPLAQRHRSHRASLRGGGRRLHRRSRRHVRDRDLGRARASG